MTATKHVGEFVSSSNEYAQSVGETTEAAGSLAKEVKDESLTKNLSNIEAVHEAGVKAAKFAKSNLETFSSDLTAIKDPRETVKEEVVEGANMVTEELEGGVSKLNECVDTVVKETNEFGETCMGTIGEVDAAIEGQKNNVKENQEGAEKRAEENMVKANAHRDAGLKLVEKLEGQNRKYVDEIVKCEEDVSDAPEMKFYQVDEFVYATATSQAIAEEFDEDDQEKLEKGVSPVKVPVEIGVVDLMSIEDKIKQVEKERREIKKRENDENAAKTGINKPPERRRSSIGPDASLPLADVSKKEINSPSRRTSAAVKRAKSPKSRRGSVASTSSRPKSPRPSTAGTKGRPTSTRARGGRTSRNGSGTIVTSKDI